MHMWSSSLLFLSLMLEVTMAKAGPVTIPAINSDTADQYAAHGLTKRLARAKLVQYASNDCDYDESKAKPNISEVVDPGEKTCVDIDNNTASFWLGRGTGLVWRRKMTAYSAPGCQIQSKVEAINEKDVISPKDLDCILPGLAIAGDFNQGAGRLSSILFEYF